MFLCGRRKTAGNTYQYIRYHFDDHLLVYFYKLPWTIFKLNKAKRKQIFFSQVMQGFPRTVCQEEKLVVKNFLGVSFLLIFISCQKDNCKDDLTSICVKVAAFAKGRTTRCRSKFPLHQAIISLASSLNKLSLVRELK